jgi:hypothetical protein
VPISGRSRHPWLKKWGDPRAFLLRESGHQRILFAGLSQAVKGGGRCVILRFRAKHFFFHQLSTFCANPAAAAAADCKDWLNPCAILREARLSRLLLQIIVAGNYCITESKYKQLNCK